jgi:acyl-CoA synthetase (AMP-forming)/AMP-acid ligase II
MKTSGYRVSPNEVEEVVYATGLVGEVAAFGVPHPALGDAIVLVAAPPPGATLEVAQLAAECRRRFPAYMVPLHIELRQEPLPRNPNGKIDRKALAAPLQSLFETA